VANNKSEDQAPIIVKKIKKGGHGHHGGAWKVAYADFVTAMMAFFLLMWLLNATTEEQRKGIAEYFDPTPMEVSSVTSGAGGVMGGMTVSPDGARVNDTSAMTPSETPPSPTQSDPNKMSEEQLQEEVRKREDAKFEEIKKQIEKAISDSELKELSKNLKIDMTPEGLRIQVVDQDGASMFPSGSAQPYEKTVKLISMVAKVIKAMPNELSVRGHTDSAAYGEGADYTNWELSSDRANASRRVLLENGISPKKLANVVGKADTEHLNKQNPLDPQNRRVSVILLRESLTKPATSGKPAKASGSDGAYTPPTPTYTKTQGNVQFP
jgi:chemotaxis protein MotB